MKNLKKKSLSLVLAGLTLAGLAMTVDAADVSSKSGKAGAVHHISSTPWEGEEHLKLTSAWDKTFPESDKVDHTKVTFHNRYGITLAADLYMPKSRHGRMPALAVAGLFGAVKEQAAGIYAQKWDLLPWLLILPLSGKAAEMSETWQVRILTRKIFARQGIICLIAVMLTRIRLAS